MIPNKKKYDRIKEIKRANRDSASETAGKSGAGYHVSQKDRPRHRRSTSDYLSEISDDSEDE